MAGFRNDAQNRDMVYADNVDFTGAAIPSATMIANGQLLIGSTTAPNIRVGLLTSNDGSINISNGAGTINLSGVSSSQDLHTAKFIVGALAPLGGANYTTIASAIAAASSGDTIFLQTGTYTENLTLKAGVNLTAFQCDGYTGTVNIVGKMSFSGAGTSSISGIHFVDNGDYIISVTGAVQSIVVFINCTLTYLTHIAILFTSSHPNSQIALLSCNTATNAALALYTASGGGYISFNDCTNSCTGTATASTMSSGFLQLYYTSNAGMIFSSSGTASFEIDHCQFSTTNATVFALTGTAAHTIFYSNFVSGNVAAISIGAGSTASVCNDTINSSAANVITGAGTLNYGALTLTNTTQIDTALTRSAYGITPSNAVTGLVLTSTGTNTSPTWQSTTAGLFPFTDQSGDFLAVVDNGYYCSAALIATLPAAPAQGDTIIIISDTGSAIVVTANTGQKIRLANGVTSLAGTMTSSLRGDVMTLKYRTSGTTWIAESFIGTWTVV